MKNKTFYQDVYTSHSGIQKMNMNNIIKLCLKAEVGGKKE